MVKYIACIFIFMPQLNRATEYEIKLEPIKWETIDLQATDNNSRAKLIDQLFFHLVLYGQKIKELTEKTTAENPFEKSLANAKIISTFVNTLPQKEIACFVKNKTQITQFINPTINWDSNNSDTETWEPLINNLFKNLIMRNTKNTENPENCSLKLLSQQIDEKKSIILTEKNYEDILQSANTALQIICANQEPILSTKKKLKTKTAFVSCPTKALVILGGISTICAITYIFFRYSKAQQKTPMVPSDRLKMQQSSQVNQLQPGTLKHTSKNL